MKYLLLPTVFFLYVFASCSSDKTSDWQGEWQATWETDPAAFATLGSSVDYTMNGKVTFDEDQVNIKAYGYDKCVFSKDTLDHTLHWKVSNDSLILINDMQTPGMVYLIKEKSDEKIRLQLMDDIFLTLNK